jgi:hypothetical protein
MVDTRTAGIVLALLGSAKILTESKCEVCNKLPDPPLVKRKTLAGFGTAAYATCLYGSLSKQPWVDPAMKLAAASHAFLLLYSVLYLKKLCPICMLTATGAFVAASAPQPNLKRLT